MLSTFGILTISICIAAANLCTAYSLNLVGKNTIEGDGMNEFFHIIEYLYVFSFIHHFGGINSKLHFPIQASYVKFVTLRKSFLNEGQLQSKNNKAASTAPLINFFDSKL